MNGKHLDKDSKSTCLRHLDRIFIGVNTLFVFKYPLLRYRNETLKSELNDADKVSEQLEKEGVCPESRGKSSDAFVCSEEEYPESMIE